MFVGDVRCATTRSGSSWMLSGGSQLSAAPTCVSKNPQVSLASRRGLPFQQAAPGHKKSGQRARDGIDRQPRLIREKNNLQPRLAERVRELELQLGGQGADRGGAAKLQEGFERQQHRRQQPR